MRTSAMTQASAVGVGVRPAPDVRLQLLLAASQLLHRPAAELALVGAWLLGAHAGAVAANTANSLPTQRDEV
jgi:hypothetical protein